VVKAEGGAMSSVHSDYATESGELRETRVSAVAVLTINRPARRNALTPEVLDGLRYALRRLEGEPDVRAVVLAGAGGAFSSGADLKSGSLGAKGLLLDHYHPLIGTLLQLELPVIAALTGVAAGAGASLAFACDFRVADPRAYFQLSFTKIGLIPDAGSLWLLPKLVGRARALELAILARDLSASEALEWGLVTEVSEVDRCLDAAIEFGHRFGALSSSVGAVKAAMHEGADADLRHFLGYEAELQEQMQQRPDFAEALEAFRERRTPRFGPRLRHAGSR
jgi:2-(1,2-epoxy-1,2-dihydrophenyl)acetyl-CoA isomerase